MHIRSSRSTAFTAFAALASLAFMAACSDNNTDETTGTTGSTAIVRFVNASGSNLDFSNNGTIATGNGNLGFGASSTCTTVNTSNPAIAFNSAGSSSAFMSSFQQPSLAANGNYMLVAYTDANGNNQVALLPSAYTATTGQAGFRIYNLTGNTLYGSANGTSLGTTGIAPYSSGSFSSMTPGATDFSFNTGTGTSTLLDTGNQTLTAGQNTTLVIAPPAAGATTPRFFTVTGC